MTQGRRRLAAVAAARPGSRWGRRRPRVPLGARLPGDPRPRPIDDPKVDVSNSRPAVFCRLRELGKGDQIKVERVGGSSVRLVVQRTEQYDKRRFPTD